MPDVHVTPAVARASGVPLVWVVAAAVGGALMGCCLALALFNSLRQSLDPIPIARENAILRDKVQTN